MTCIVEIKEQGAKLQMKFFILSGALKNAGDFLIVERTKRLLQRVYPDSECIIFDRKKIMTKEDLDIANRCDAVIYAGGPSVRNNLYPKKVPLTPELKNITTKIVGVGMGWSGAQGDWELAKGYELDENTRELFKRIEKDAGYVSCRDWYTCKVLKSNGIMNVKMTGCPAWYNLEYLEKEYRAPEEIHKICISDPGNVLEYGQQAVDVSRYLKERFPAAEIKFVFHRGSQKSDQYTNSKTAQKALELKRGIEALGIECVDISYGYEKLKIYDSCDLHVGYRVHAHIYNLSRRGTSILIEEDARGAGVNDALNLRHICAFKKKVMIPVKNKILHIQKNRNICDEIDNWLERSIITNWQDYYYACSIIEKSGQEMFKLIENIKKER